jgi:hypothetical protein
MRGAFKKRFLKVEWEVASRPRSVSRAREVRDRAGEAGATPQTRAERAQTVTVERREAPSRLRGTAHASQTWRRVITRATG